jgi:hypothetical protein
MQIHPVAKTLQKKIPEKLREFLRQAILTVYAPAGSVCFVQRVLQSSIRNLGGCLHRVFATSKFLTHARPRS